MFLKLENLIQNQYNPYHTVISISGFLSENDNIIETWDALAKIIGLNRSSNLFSLKWKAYKLNVLIKELLGSLSFDLMALLIGYKYKPIKAVGAVILKKLC